MPPEPVYLGVKPDGLSPSRVSQFMNCPRQYQYVSVEKLPEKKSEAAYRGTIFHAILEALYRDQPTPDDRTLENAMVHFREIFPEYMTDEAITELGFDELAVQKYAAEVTKLIRVYFTMEDPTAINLVSTEQRLDYDMGGWGVRGIIDRFDRLPDGTLAIRDYKGLALDTPIPTPSGWTTMEQLQVGDVVFGSDGNPCNVTVKSQIHHRPCYKLTFSDSSDIVCDNEHYWEVSGKKRRNNVTTEILTTDELYDRWQNGQRPFTIDNTLPLQTPTAKLPIDPYTLGCWLGDGISKAGSLAINYKDLDHFSAELLHNGENVQDATSTRDKDHGSAVLTLKRSDERTALRTRLREEGLLDNKHIPSEYLRASCEQRLALLQGLMDTDGYWNPKRRAAVFSNTNRNLIDGLAELVASLGSKFYIFEVPPCKFTRNTAWQVIFTPHHFNPFRLERKGREIGSKSATSGRRSIRSIEKVESVPTQCIQVDSPNHLYLAGRQMIPTHNTGKVPKGKYADKALQPSQVYAFLAEKVLGERPSVMTLLYVKTGEIIERAVTPTDIRNAEQRVRAVWDAVERCYDKGYFPAQPSVLCNWCAFQKRCNEDNYSVF